MILEPEVEVDVFRYNKDYMEQSEVSRLLNPPLLKKPTQAEHTIFYFDYIKFSSVTVIFMSFTDHIVYLTFLDYLNALYMSFNKH